MTKLKVCKEHSESKYTLKDACPTCKKPTLNAHYKFLKLGSLNEDAKESFDK